MTIVQEGNGDVIRRRVRRSEQELQVELVARCVVQGESVTKVAKQLGLSRTKAHDLLKGAKRQGMVETSVTLRPGPQHELAQRIRAHWRSHGLEEVRIVPSAARDSDLVASADYRDFIRRYVGLAVADFVGDLGLQENDHVAVSGGRLVLEFAKYFRPSVAPVIFRPLVVGGPWRLIETADASVALQVLHARLGHSPGRRVYVVCPGLPAGGATADVRSRPEIRAIFDEAPAPAATISVISRRTYKEPESGQAEPHEEVSAFVRLVGAYQYYSSTKGRKALEAEPELIYKPLELATYHDANKTLQQAGVVGVVNWHGIDGGGNLVLEELADKIGLTVSPKRLREWRESDGTHTIGVASTTKRAPAVRAALRGRFFHTLICDLALGVQLVPRDERPEEYRDVPEVA